MYAPSSLVIELAAAMAFHIDRKLIFESLDDFTPKICYNYYCNPEVHHSNICPLSCFYICRGICLVPEIELPPPPQNFTTEVPPSQSPHKNAASIFLTLLFTGLGIAVCIFCSFVIRKFHSSGTSSQPEQQVVVEEIFKQWVFSHQSSVPSQSASIEEVKG